jgi:hypothetical protein
MADIPQKTLVYRLNSFLLGLTDPQNPTVDVTVNGGIFIEDEEGTRFLILNEIKHHVDSAQGKAIFFGNPNGDVTRLQDIRAAVQDYLIEHKIIHGELIE